MKCLRIQMGNLIIKAKINKYGKISLLNQKLLMMFRDVCFILIFHLKIFWIKI
jgi:hypothetical protein